MPNRWTPARRRASVTCPMPGSDHSVSDRSRCGVAVLLIALIVVLTYGASLRGAWVYDDWPAIVDNATIRSVARAWVPPADTGSPIGGRPIVNVSFAMNYALGGLRPWAYHAVNLAIHLGATLLLFGVVRRTWRCGRTASEASAWRGNTVDFLAFVIATAWAVHPLDTEAVMYIAQRAESLMAFFYLLTLYALIRATAGEAASSDASGNRGRGWLTVSAVACALGMATKEVMVSAPVLVALYDRTFVAGSLADAWRRRRGYYLALAATWLVLAVLVVRSGDRGGTAGFAGPATWWSYAAVQLRAHIWYLRLALWPHPLIFDYGTDVLPWPGRELVCGAGLAILLALAAMALWRRWRVGWVAALYFAVLGPTSTVLPIGTEPLAEHRMYLPLATLFAVGAAAVGLVTGRRGAIALLAGSVPLALLTVHRAAVYRSEMALWSDTVANWPANARGRYNLARARFAAGNVGGAVEEYEAALRLRPAFASAHANLAQARLRLGEVDAGRSEAEAAIRLDPRLPEAHNNLGHALLAIGDAAGAVREYGEAVRLAPANIEMRSNYATALLQAGRSAAALAEFQTLVREHPEWPLLHFNFANTLARSGKFHEATVQYLETLRLDPNYPHAREYLARARELEQGAP